MKEYTDKYTAKPGFYKPCSTIVVTPIKEDHCDGPWRKVCDVSSGLDLITWALLWKRAGMLRPLDVRLAEEGKYPDVPRESCMRMNPLDLIQLVGKLKGEYDLVKNLGLGVRAGQKFSFISVQPGINNAHQAIEIQTLFDVFSYREDSFTFRSLLTVAAEAIRRDLFIGWFTAEEWIANGRV